MARLVAGIDSSTQSTKVELREIDSGAVVAVGRAAHPSTTPPRSEQDPESWWSALTTALADVADHLGDVIAVSVAGQQHGLVMLDAEGAAIRPAKLWNDTESSAEADALVADLGADGWARACGSVPGAAFTISKLAWVAANEPEAMKRLDRIMLPHDYLTWRLSGAHVTDRGDASGTGWWSPSIGDYDVDLLDRAAPNLDDSVLPTVLGPSDSAGVVTAAGLGFGRDVLVGPGTGDNMAGALGLGLGPGDLAISVGTSGTAYSVSATPTSDASGAVAGFADATGNFLPLVCTLNATKVTDAIGRLLGAGFAELDELALAAEPGAGGLTLVPYFDGERTPNRPDATGALSGLRSDVSREQFARAGFEGVACGLLDGVDALVDVGADCGGRMFLLGGGAKSMAYQRVFADLAERQLIVPEAEEVVATGACVQAAVIAGEGSFSEIALRWGLGTGTTVDPADVDSATIRLSYAGQRS